MNVISPNKNNELTFEIINRKIYVNGIKEPYIELFECEKYTFKIKESLEMYQKNNKKNSLYKLSEESNIMIFSGPSILKYKLGCIKSRGKLIIKCNN